MLWHGLILRAVQRARAAPSPCPRCGRPVPSTRAACRACGAALAAAPQAAGPTRAGRADGWIALAIALLLLGTLAYLGWQQDPAPAVAPAVEGPP